MKERGLEGVRSEGERGMKGEKEGERVGDCHEREG